MYESLGFKECGRISDANKYDEGAYTSHIIFICLFDAYGKGRHIYTFENISGLCGREKPEDSFVEQLEEVVKEAKKNREWRREYMTLLMRDRENVEKGEDKLAQLIKLLSEDNRLADIVRVTDDKAYRRELYEEYHII